MSLWYKLEGTEVLPCEISEVQGTVIVKKTRIRDIEVSTVFLGLDHSMIKTREKGNHIPLVFETMVFGGENDGYLKRYHYYKEALLGHRIIVKSIKKNE